MASDFSFTDASASLDGLPAFFTNGSVDDKKYESLLADLRAHDLLGPLDSDATDAFGASSAGTGSSSLFFNDAFSAVFTSSFSDSKSLFPDASAGSSSAASGSSGAKPPPGFARAPPGLAPSETDLKWARGQQTFSRLEEQFHAPTARPAAGASDDSELAFDESAFLNLRALGLDDDDATTSPVKRAPAPTPAPAGPPGLAPTQQPAPPLPSSLPPPPPAPYAPTSGFAPNDGPQPPPPQGPTHPPPPPPPPGPWNNNGQQQQPPMHHPPPPPPPHMYNGQPPQHMHPPPPPPHMFMRGPPPPHGMGFPPPPPPPFGMAGPPFGPMQPPPRPSFKMMTPRDINFVVQQQLKQIRSSDPFSDDYYFHNYVQKRTRAVAAPGLGPRPPALPLPSWKLEHVKSVDPRDAQREAGSRNWEASYHVLGRNSKGSLYRPKQLLALGGAPADATAAEDTSPEASGDAAAARPPTPPVESEPKVLKMDAAQSSVFSNDTWQKRLEIDRGMQCLLSLQDARHILDARGINVQQFHAMDEREIDPSLAALRTRTTALLVELAGLLGVSAAADEPQRMACQLEQLYKMLYTVKGKKLVSRALPLLHPSARFVLLPHLVEYLLSARNVARFSGADEQDEGDERLCQTLVLILMYHPLAPSPELFAESLQRAMDGHDMDTLARLLHNRARAEALQALLQRGGAAVQQVESAQVKHQWDHFQAQFVSLATAIKQTA